jgi:uncharacterized damage-inducible protein DinB
VRPTKSWYLPRNKLLKWLTFVLSNKKIMAKINTQKLIDALETRVDNQLKDAIEIFQNLDEKILLKKSATGGWSIVECLWHLNSYGDFYLPEFEKALSKNLTNSPTFTSGWLGNYFTNLMKPGDGMKKMKAFKNHTPATITEPYQIVSSFIEQQEQLLTLLKRARLANLTNTKVPISIAHLVKLRLGDVFQFYIEHVDRHMLQAKRNLG